MTIAVPQPLTLEQFLQLPYNVALDWMIEILSSEQSQMKVTHNILHSLRHGGQMGWLVDPDERVVLVYRPNCLPDELTDDAQLLCLPGVNLTLTVDQMFGWLKVGGTF